MSTNADNIRPSSLPKFALCGQWESAPGTSEAAARGTRIDSIFRHMWLTGEIPNGADIEELKVAHWAVNELLRIGNSNMTTTDERQCRIFVPIIDKWGTMDALNMDGNWLADLKTGQMHNYKEQMAAYALGCMEATNEQEWTAYLLFADQKEIVTHRFSYVQARKIVTDAVLNIGNDPTPNDYCGWCAKSLTCQARVEAQRLALAITEGPSFEMVLNDPVRLGEFLTKAKVFDDFREAAKDQARALLEAGAEVPGWRLQKPRVTETLSADAQLASGLPLEELIKAHGAISAKKAREIGAIDELKVTRKETARILSQA